MYKLRFFFPSTRAYRSTLHLHVYICVLEGKKKCLKNYVKLTSIFNFSINLALYAVIIKTDDLCARETRYSYSSPN